MWGTGMRDWWTGILGGERRAEVGRKERRQIKTFKVNHNCSVRQTERLTSWLTDSMRHCTSRHTTDDI